MKILFFNINTLVGTGLGLGYLTSLRFFGSIGISEILILISIIILFKKNYRTLLEYKKDSESFIKIILLSSVILVFPLITAITYFISDYSDSSAPEYIISFIMGVLLTFLLLDALRKKQVDIKKVSLWFFLIFVSTNFISIFIFNLDVPDQRYTGGAKNPNQLLFYASTLTLMLTIYHRKYFLVLLPIIIFIMLKTKSDAYGFSLILMGFVYTYLKVLSMKKFNFAINITLHVTIILILLYISITQYGELIDDIWLGADEGDGRRYLMWNALLVSIKSPLFGWGAGSFSGVDMPFQHSEAHNTFLDLSMQFGFIFPIIIYAIFLSTLFLSIKKHDYLLSAFIVGFIESGLFHFSGRHFVFWVEIAIFLYYLFPIKNIHSKGSKKCVV